jgi:sec-independent protein translocase protein TatC
MPPAAGIEGRMPVVAVPCDALSDRALLGRPLLPDSVTSLLRPASQCYPGPSLRVASLGATLSVGNAQKYGWRQSMTASRVRKGRDQLDEEVPAGAMGFLEHLDELRTRIIRCCVALALGMLVSFTFVGRIADFVLEPTLRALPPGTSLIMTRLGEGLSFYMDVALLCGVVLAAPFITYQVWQFIAPGLYSREKRLVLPFILLASLGTMAGALFSHYVLFPAMVTFFSTFDSPQMRLMPRVEDAFGLYKNLLIGMVVVFQIPTLVFVLARLGLITARLLWDHLQYAVLASFVAAALLTPSVDPWNQAVFAAPMIALYVIGIGVAWLAAPRRTSSDASGAATQLTLVFAAGVAERAARRERPAPALSLLAGNRHVGARHDCRPRLRARPGNVGGLT